MRYSICASLLILFAACAPVRGSGAGPIISNISTSGKTLVISDCLGTSITFNAKVSSESKIASVLLFYRVGSDALFESIPMAAQGENYTALLQGKALQGKGYGDLEFYISAADERGNAGKSPVDKSIQFLPCVNH